MRAYTTALLFLLLPIDLAWAEDAPEEDATTEEGAVEEAAAEEASEGDAVEKTEQPAAEGEGAEDVEDVEVKELSMEIPKTQELDEAKVQTEHKQAWEQMQYYGRTCSNAMIGEVLASRKVGNSIQVTMLVKEPLFGVTKVDEVVNFFVPTVMDRGGAGHLEVQPSVIEGYTMLVFLDGAGIVIDGNAMYLWIAGAAWRNKRNDLFLKPDTDREWNVNIDPSNDYHIFMKMEVLNAIGDRELSRRTRRKLRKNKK